jgi:hypothetical protein
MLRSTGKAAFFLVGFTLGAAALASSCLAALWAWQSAAQFSAPLLWSHFFGSVGVFILVLAALLGNRRSGIRIIAALTAITMTGLTVGILRVDTYIREGAWNGVVTLLALGLLGGFFTLFKAWFELAFRSNDASGA